jgi:hypothetical protein
LVKVVVFTLGNNSLEECQKVVPRLTVFCLWPEALQGGGMENQALVLVKKTLIRAHDLEQSVKNPPRRKG